MKIGDLLKSARVEKGLTLSQIAKDLFVQERYLRALEEGEYDLIPGEAYQRAYFRSYAEYLGLGEYIEDLTRPHQFTSDTEEKPVEDAFGGAWDSKRIGRVALRLGSFFLVIVLIVVFVRVAHTHPKTKPQPNRVNSTQPIVIVPIDQQHDWNTQGDSTQQAPAPQDQLSNLEHKIKLVARGTCWVTLKTRDKTLVNRNMEIGDTLTFTDLVGFYLRAGIPEKLEVTFDGHRVPWSEGEISMVLPQGAAVLQDQENQTTPDSGNTTSSTAGH